MKIELEIPRRLQRALLVGLCASILCGGAVAYAQSTVAATTTDTLVGSALNTLGNAVATLKTEVAILQMSERVARATITGTGNVTTQTGSWISRVDHPVPGQYVIRFTAGVFAAAPTCVASANADGPVAPAIECYGVTPSSIVCQATATAHPVDTALSLICAGS